MPMMNRNQSRSDRPGLGLGPCGAGQARGRMAKGSAMKGRAMRCGNGRSNGAWFGRGIGRGNGMCRFSGMNAPVDERYETSLEKRIIELEDENRKLRAMSAER
ncbi:hypothetical protein [Maridesulfovibrio sp.]|uniref:hypothetical protein n=1 Tax=Maridesulfovibrio sp. TaxID=2795000 RepID=UPI002A18BDDC|nr:hypothetical protein [Maridesulfovibrio sp.]